MSERHESEHEEERHDDAELSQREVPDFGGLEHVFSEQTRDLVEGLARYDENRTIAQLRAAGDPDADALQTAFNYYHSCVDTAVALASSPRDVGLLRAFQQALTTLSTFYRQYIRPNVAEGRTAVREKFMARADSQLEIDELASRVASLTSLLKDMIAYGMWKGPSLAQRTGTVETGMQRQKMFKVNLQQLNDLLGPSFLNVKTRKELRVDPDTSSFIERFVNRRRGTVGRLARALFSTIAVGAGTAGIGTGGYHGYQYVFGKPQAENGGQQNPSPSPASTHPQNPSTVRDTRSTATNTTPRVDTGNPFGERDVNIENLGTFKIVVPFDRSYVKFVLPNTVKKENLGKEIFFLFATAGDLLQRLPIDPARLQELAGVLVYTHEIPLDARKKQIGAGVQARVNGVWKESSMVTYTGPSN